MIFRKMSALYSKKLLDIPRFMNCWTGWIVGCTRRGEIFNIVHARPSPASGADAAPYKYANMQIPRMQPAELACDSDRQFSVVVFAICMCMCARARVRAFVFLHTFVGTRHITPACNGRRCALTLTHITKQNALLV